MEYGNNEQSKKAVFLNGVTKRKKRKIIMEYAIFPMETINISQRHNGSYSHAWNGTTGNGCKAIDLGGKENSGTGIRENVYAPTTVKVLWINSSSNTVAYGTCDDRGNPATVMCEDGIARILTFVFIHADDSTLRELGIVVNKVFTSGTVCYKEGTKANGKANGAALHVHFEVAEGWAESFNSSRELNYSTATITPTYRFKNPISLFPHQIFHKLRGWNVVGTASGLNGYTMKEVSSRTTGGTVDPPTDALSGCYMHAIKSPFRVRSSVVNGTPLATVPIGGKAEVTKFLGIQSDGYQWVQVSYINSIGCIPGYSQLDTKAYTLVGACSKTLYLYATKSAFRLRTAPVTGNEKTICPIGAKAQILWFDNMYSDGYQWAYVRYNGFEGYAQMDTKNCYTVNV